MPSIEAHPGVRHARGQASPGGRNNALEILDHFAVEYGSPERIKRNLCRGVSRRLEAARAWAQACDLRLDEHSSVTERGFAGRVVFPGRDGKTLPVGVAGHRVGHPYPASSGKVSACLSVGSDPNSDSLLFKGDKSYPNEDCLVALCSGSQWLLAVADGHAGHHTSHAIIDGLHQMEGIPSELTARLSHFRFPPQIRGGTTLVVALFNEESRRVVGA